MKKIIYTIVPCIMALFTACEEDFIELTPPASITDNVYYNEAEHFLTGSNRFYTNLMGWKDDQGIFSDHGSDLVGYFEEGGMQEHGRGQTLPSLNDDYYTDAYEALRDINLLIERSETYSGSESITEYVAAAKFHRAWQYFFLVQRFGGVVLVTRSLDVDSEELSAPRNSRYEVVAQILIDLDAAISGLPSEANIASQDKGKFSKEAAMAFKADVLLHEATWMKYVGTTTDGNGTSDGAGIEGTVYLGNDALYNPELYSYDVTTTGVGERECLLIQPTSTRNFSIDNYLFPIPTSQVSEFILQNSGY